MLAEVREGAAPVPAVPASTPERFCFTQMLVIERENVHGNLLYEIHPWQTLSLDQKDDSNIFVIHFVW